MGKARLDNLLLARGMVENIELARSIIMSGNVYVSGQRYDKPGMLVSEDTQIDLRSEQEYVSRGGLKLKPALQHFSIDPQGKVCIDCGASTGGFTDCLLKHGAKFVYAVDVGYGLLAWSLRNDQRVKTIERTNIRYATREMFDFDIELAVIDVSFISLSKILPVVRELLVDDGEVLCLIKPQFEAKREDVGEKGVVRDLNVHVDVLNSFMQYAKQSRFSVRGITYSTIKGPEGNIEFFGWLGCMGDNEDIDTLTIANEAHITMH